METIVLNTALQTIDLHISLNQAVMISLTLKNLPYICTEDFLLGDLAIYSYLWKLMYILYSINADSAFVTEAFRLSFFVSPE